jgi:hypothetical protein
MSDCTDRFDHGKLILASAAGATLCKTFAIQISQDMNGRHGMLADMFSLESGCLIPRIPVAVLAEPEWTL